MKTRRLSIRFKLFLAFSAIGLFTATLISLQSFISANNTLMRDQEKILTSVRNIKVEQIQNHVGTLLSQFIYFSQNTSTEQAAKEIDRAFHTMQPASGKTLEVCTTALHDYYANTYLPVLQNASRNSTAEKPEAYMPHTELGITLQCEFIVNAMLPPDKKIPLPGVSDYKKSYSRYDPLFDEYREKNNLKDLMIIDYDGFVIYSSSLNVDFATNINTGPWSSTKLKEAYLYGRNQIRTDVSRIFDFTFYLPSALMPTAFVVSPIMNNGSHLGILVGTIDSAQFDEIVTSNYKWESDGLGKTGEGYLIGNDLTMRSNSRLIMENLEAFSERMTSLQYPPQLLAMMDVYRSTVLLQRVPTDAAIDIFDGEAGIRHTINYLGNRVISAYAPLAIPDLKWGIIVEITEQEATGPARALQTDILQSMVLVVGIVIILTIFVSAAIVRPISDLNVAVTGLTDGDYSRRINDASNDEMGELSRAFDLMADTITERSQALLKVNNTLSDEIQERKQTENMLQTLTVSAQDAIVISDENDNIISWNESAEKMFGYSQEEITRKPIIPTLIPAKYEEYFIRSADRVGSGVFNNDDTKIGFTSEIEAMRKDRELFPVELSMSLVKVRGLWNTLYVVRDISIRKQREEELRRALEKARVAEKTKTEFLANMSHEIRTPLNGILGFLELLSQTQLTSSQEEYLKIINSSAGSLLGVINEILDFSKIESGMMKLETVEFNVYSELEQVTDLYVAKANEKKIDLLLDIDTNIPPYLVGDPLRIRQILSNLLSNATKFTHSGGHISLKAELLGTKEHSCTVRLAVKDTGIGISEDTRNNIFKAFSQADNSVTRKYGGTGLGLAISSKLARLMESNLMLESEVGRGSIFWVDLELTTSTGSIAKAPFSELKVAILLGAKIMTDHERTLIRYLKALGCDVHTVTEPAELTWRSGLSIIFVDYNAVDNTRIEKLRDIIPGSARIVVAGDSERTDLGSISKYITHTIFKPVNMSKLVNVLNEITYGTKRPDAERGAAGYTFSGHVLVAEDNPVNQQLIQIMLTKLGITVEIAENGEVASSLAAGKRYDLIFMDIHMPVMDGLTATTLIINHERENVSPHTPIIALTANVIREDRVKYADAGMDDFLAKPIVQDDLLEILKKYLPYSKSDAADTDGDALKTLADSMGLADLIFVRSILSEFVSLTEEQINTINSLVNEGRYGEVTPIIISIKGAAANLQLKNIIYTLEKLDTECKTDKHDCIYFTNELHKEIMDIRKKYDLESV